MIVAMKWVGYGWMLSAPEVRCYSGIDVDRGKQRKVSVRISGPQCEI